MKPPTCSTCGAPNDELGRALPPKDPDKFRHPVLTVDAIAVRTGAQGPEVLLIRGQPPHEGRMAFWWVRGLRRGSQDGRASRTRGGVWHHRR